MSDAAQLTLDGMQVLPTLCAGCTAVGDWQVTTQWWICVIGRHMGGLCDRCGCRCMNEELENGQPAPHDQGLP